MDVISLAGILFAHSTRLVGDKMDESIIQFIRKKYNLQIGERMAESIKIEIGEAYPGPELLTKQVKGRDLVSGIPKTIEVNSDEIREALKEAVNAIVDTVLICLEKTPPELAADIVDKGIFLAGGGALLRNLDMLLRDITKVPVLIAENPLDCVALGSGKVLDELDLLRRVSISS